jgi:hypothetical protein
MSVVKHMGRAKSEGRQSAHTQMLSFGSVVVPFPLVSLAFLCSDRLTTHPLDALFAVTHTNAVDILVLILL